MFNKKIAWIQIVLGVLLILVVIFSSSIIPGKMWDLNQEVSINYNEALMENNLTIGINTTAGQISGQGLLTRGVLGIENLVLFGLLETILAVLALMLILQGLVNLDKKNNS